MRYLLNSTFIFIMLLFCYISCEKQNILDSQIPVLTEGNWEGELDSRRLFLTLIEGRFENSPTLTGSAHLSSDSFTSSYLIMGGTHNGQDSVWFGLYKPNTSGKENFQFQARIVADSLIGIFKEFNDQSFMLKEGMWYAKRIP